MPSLTEHKSNTGTKLLLLGDSGTGKTGALASLARAGYNLRILDFDNGLDILANLLATEPDALSRISYATVTDKFKKVGPRLCVPAPTAWGKGTALLDNWKTETENFGPITTWSSDNILVIDSLTLLSNAALRAVLATNGRAAGDAQIQDWGAAMNMIESLCGLLYSASVQCHVIVISHITYIGEENPMGYPSALGNKLPPKISRYFNAVLRAFVRGTGRSAKRLIATSSQGNVALKTPNPKIPAELPLDTGLAEYFKLVSAIPPKGAE